VLKVATQFIASPQASLGEIIYRRKLAAARNGGLGEWIGAAPEGVVSNLPCPKGTRPDIWEGLSAGSKCKSFLSRWDKTIAGGALRGGLTELDFLQMSYPKTALQSLAMVQRILGCTYNNQRNPTLEGLVNYVDARVTSGEPLRVFLSQCFSREAQVRESKLSYFLGGDQRVVEVPRFIKGVETLGWDAIGNLIKSSGGRIEVSILLGDMDWFCIDGCSEWAAPQSLKRLDEEVAACQRALQTEATTVFPGGEVTIRRWSEFYRVEDCLAELERAATRSVWKETALIGESTRMYLKEWGYGRIARARGATDQAMASFVEGDCIRTAAQYRVEANVISRLCGIQAWAERVPSPLWPLKITNYDGAGVPPTLFLLGA